MPALPACMQVAVRIPNDPTSFRSSHLLFLFFHASSVEKKTSPFAYSFLPLTASATAVATLPDGAAALKDKEYKVPHVLPVLLAFTLALTVAWMYVVSCAAALLQVQRA